MVISFVQIGMVVEILAVRCQSNCVIYKIQDPNTYLLQLDYVVAILSKLGPDDLGVCRLVARNAITVEDRGKTSDIKRQEVKLAADG